MSIWERILPGLDAYPAIHPFAVHVPVAVLPLALLFAILSLRERIAEPPALVLFSGLGAGRIARILLIIAVPAAVGAVITGLAAALDVAHSPGSLVESHRNFMLVTTVLAVLLIIAFRREAFLVPLSNRRLFAAGLLLVNSVLILGADRGALVALRIQGSAALPRATDVSPVIEKPVGATGATVDGDVDHGRSLYDRLRCAACHDAGRREEAPGIPPSLEFAGSRLTREWMGAYLLRPEPRRWVDDDRPPVVRMPDYRLSAVEAADLAAFLATRTDTAMFPVPPITSPPLTSEEAARGRELVAEYACLGCHEISGAGSRLGPSLDGTGDRLQPAYVHALLMDPQAVVPGTPMKNFRLWDEETRALTAYLMALHAGPGPTGPVPR